MGGKNSKCDISKMNFGNDKFSIKFNERGNPVVDENGNVVFINNSSIKGQCSKLPFEKDRKICENLKRTNSHAWTSNDYKDNKVINKKLDEINQKSLLCGKECEKGLDKKCLKCIENCSTCPKCGGSNINKKNFCDYYSCVLSNPDCNFSGQSLRSKTIDEYTSKNCNIPRQCEWTQNNLNYSTLGTIKYKRNSYDTNLLI